MAVRIKYLFVFIFLNTLISLPLILFAQNQTEIPEEQRADINLIADNPDLTNARSISGEEDFNKGLINDPLKLIQGRIPGLIISKPGGDPNGVFVSRLRGIQSIGGSSEPLIVINGFPGASFESVDPADIESIEVLRDIGATAIYGLRGGNGVILIETKSGKNGKPVARYSGSVSFDKARKNLAYMSAEEYRKLTDAIDFGSDTDWLEEVTQTGISQVHNLSLSGGDSQTSYYTSFNYRNVEGIAINTGFERLNARVNLKQKFFGDMGSIGFLLATSENKRKPGINDVFAYAVSTNPTIPVFYDGTPELEDIGGYSERIVFDHYNPVSIAEQAVNDLSESITSGNLFGEMDLRTIASGLGFSFALSSQTDNQLSGKYFPNTLMYNGLYRNGLAERTMLKSNTNLADTKLHYRHDGEFIKFDIEGGYFFQDFFEEGFAAEGGDFLTNAFSYNNLSAAQDFAKGRGSADSYTSSHKIAAFYSQAKFNFQDMYFLNLVGRYEGSSRFGINEKWAFFPGVSLGFRLKEIMEMNLFEYLQGRVSFGSSGRIPETSYLSIQKYDESYGNVFYDGKYIPSYQINTNENPDLGTERTSEINLGFDFGFAEGKISGSLDWYQRNTKDMIVQVFPPVPPNLGWYSYVNLGQLRNQGLDFSFNWKVLDNSSMTYQTSLVFATYNTKVVSLSNEEYSLGHDGVIKRGYAFGPGHGGFAGLVRTKEGERFGDFWGNVFIGIDQDGRPIYEDVNKDGYACDYCDEDSRIIGNAMPDLTLGWANTLKTGHFEFDIFFRGVFGHDLYNIFRGAHENTETTTVRFWNVVNTRYFNPNLKRAGISDLQVENASYFALDNITISYHLPDSPELGLIESQVFITGQNLFTITGYSGIDPEVRLTDDAYRDYDPLAPGIERKSTYLPTRTVTIGLQLSF